MDQSFTFCTKESFNIKYFVIKKRNKKKGAIPQTFQQIIMVDQTDSNIIMTMEPMMMQQVLVDEEDIEQEEELLLLSISMDGNKEVVSSSTSSKRTLFGAIVMFALVAAAVIGTSTGSLTKATTSSNDRNNNRKKSIRSLQSTNTIISQQNVRIYGVYTTTNLTTGTDRRRMNGTGGSWFEYNENVGFKSREFNVTWNSNTIDTLIDSVSHYHDDPNTICLERSTFLPNMTSVSTVGIIFMTNQARTLLTAINKKIVQLETSSTRNIASPIIDTSGSQYGYKKTKRISSGLTTSSTWQNSESAFLFNSTGFYSPKVTLRWGGTSGGTFTKVGTVPTVKYLGQTYKISHDGGDTETIAFEKVYIDPLDSNKEITEGVVFETRHATQLMKFFSSK